MTTKIPEGTRLPTHAEPDDKGISTYPEMLTSVNGAELLHLSGKDGYGTLCGVSTHFTMATVEYVGRRRFVCAKCRASFLEAKAGTKAKKTK